MTGMMERAVRTWAEGLPAWQTPLSLAEGIRSVLAASYALQAHVFSVGEGTVPLPPTAITASDRIRPDGWEALEALVKALEEVTG